MESLFSRLFKYRQSDNRTPEEDFFTEIFAFLLKNVDGLLSEFLNQFDVTIQSQLENIKVEPQYSFSTYPDRIQPDISIRFSLNNQKWFVFVENKVGAIEGKNQLEKYINYLGKETSEDTNCALLYITQFYDPKTFQLPPGVTFHQFRWWQIYETLDRFKDNTFVSQARLFMKERGLSMSRNFSPAQILTMMQWNAVREMMDESMRGAVKEKFEQIAGRYSTTSSDRNLRIYGDYFQAAGSVFWIEIGYFFTHSDDENYPSVGGAIVVEPSYSNRLQVIQAFKEFVRKNTTWVPFGDFDNEEGTVWITKGWSLNELIGLDDHIGAIQKRFLEILSDVEAFQKDNPELSWG